MREASTQNLTDLIKRKLKSGHCKGQLILERWTGSAWQEISDLDVERGVDWEKSAKKYKYANFALTPQASTIGFSIINEDGKYSEGSGETEAGYFDLNTKVRLKAGYLIKDQEGSSAHTAGLNSAEAFTYYTKYNAGNYIELDATNSDANTDIYFTDLFDVFYDDGTKYDGGTYTPAGYFLYTYDMERDDYKTVQTFVINCNNTNGTVYWRMFNNRIEEESLHQTSAYWTNAGATVDGNKTVTVNETERYIQIAVIFDGVKWSDDIRVNNLVINYLSNIEWLYYDVFYLDTPQFSDPPAPEIPRVQCQGRDVFKRAIETTINLQDLSGGKALDQLIKDICDVVGIPYSATSIADLTSFSNRTLAGGIGSSENPALLKAVDIFELIMQVINQGTARYQMYVEYDSTEDDNILFVQPKPSTYAADFVFNYQHYESLGGKRKNYDKLLKRTTIISDSQVPDKEEQLDQQTYTTTGTKTLSWSGSAEFKRFTVESLTGDESTVTLTGVTPTTMVFEITLASGLSTVNVKITGYGCKWNTDPSYEGEALNYDNTVNNEGHTHRIVNPLVLSDAESKAMSESFVTDFGTPVWEAFGLTWPYLNLLPEINDMDLVWSRWTFTDDLFFIVSIRHHWDLSKNPGDRTTLNLDDSGLNFSDEGDFIYDRDFYYTANPIAYDTGFVYDMTHGVGATQAEAEAAYVPTQNVGFS